MSSHFRVIGEALRGARKARKLSQAELSKQLGIGQATLSRAETSSEIQLGTLQQIARALDLEPMLVPRRLVPVVDAIVRHGTSEAAESDDEGPYNEAYDEPAGERG